MNVLACAFTGHRPDRFSFGYNESDERCLKIKTLMSEHIRKLIVEGTEIFYSGMAIGVDIWAAEIVLELKKEHPCISLIAVVPCKTQADRWSEEQKERYRTILAACDEVIILNDHYTRGCMHQHILTA